MPFELLIEKDVAIAMNDGNVLRANIHRPRADGRFPVVMTHGVYGKDVHFADTFAPQWKQLHEIYPGLSSEGSTPPSAPSTREGRKRISGGISRAFGRGVTFMSAPFDADTEFTGFVSAQLWISSSTSEMDILVVGGMARPAHPVKRIAC
jgi:X-Pro dipeptidyl-peptidase C-terminal non-catalytic domain